uniref:Uncharacterized protein n=1 Tax=Megaselia scalaris TaxID=36166 RepID=T1GQL4_MEGSC
YDETEFLVDDLVESDDDFDDYDDENVDEASQQCISFSRHKTALVRANNADDMSDDMALAYIKQSDYPLKKLLFRSPNNIFKKESLISTLLPSTVCPSSVARISIKKEDTVVAAVATSATTATATTIFPASYYTF